MANRSDDTTPPQASRSEAGSGPVSRRAMMQGSLLATAASLAGVQVVMAQTALRSETEVSPELSPTWDKVFPKSDRVDHEKVVFKNRYGFTLAADLYLPKNRGDRKLAAIVVAGPFGAVKEQSSGLYAQTMAERGFLTLAFDPSFTGESSGQPRNIASADINTEDFSAAVDFIGLHPSVDRERIGGIGICGFGGLALNAVAVDKRVKAVVSSTMYDMSRSASKGPGDSMTQDQRTARLVQVSNQRWVDAEKGTPAYRSPANVLRGGRLRSSSIFMTTI